MTYEKRTVSVVVLPDGETIFSEQATTIRIEDEGAGEYVVVSQESMPGRGSVAFNPEEWPAIRDAIDGMIAECRS